VIVVGVKIVGDGGVVAVVVTDVDSIAVGLDPADAGIFIVG